MNRNIERTKDGMGSLIDRTRDAVVGVADQTERGVESAAERVVKTTQAAGEYLRGGAATASRGAHRRLDGAASAIDRGYSRAASDLSRSAEAVTDYVTENPGKALMVAASSGFVLGVLLRRRRR